MRDAAAPDLFGDVFQWHEKYLPPAVLRDRLLLLSENELLVLGSPGVMALERVLREGVSLATHCRDAGAGALLAEMLHALGALLRQGLVRPVMLRGGEAYLLPDFSAPHTPMAVTVRVEAISLTDAVGRGAAMRWGQALAEALDGAEYGAGDGPGLTIVYCDDYLDPRLGAIDARQRAKGQPWLLVKPAGEQAMVGPLFTPRAGGSEGEAPACWHCLAHRWLRNRPARAWWRARHGDLDSGPPVRAGASLVAERLDGLLVKARQMLVAPPGEAQAVWTLDPLERNPVAARPQCPQCGNPGLMALLQRERIAPAPGGPVAGADGGWRTVPASATVERLSRHVGPLCGVIARVRSLNAESDDMLTVYRSEIFKTPQTFGDPAPGAWMQTCLGKGMSAAQSRASAMCEAVERYAAFYQGDEATVIAPAADLDARCVPPTALAHFSEHQKSQFGTEKPPHAVAAADAGPEPAWWVPAWSLTADARCYLPLAFCHAHAPAESQYHVTWTSNGCAAGNTLEEAILQGFLELVERDAAAIWWYGRVRRPAIDLDGMPVATRLRLSRTWGLQWAHWVLDITHDFGIPVVAAVGRHRQTGEWAVGFGCSPDRMLACERALTEMSQLIAAGKTFPVPGADGAHEAPAFLAPMEEAGAVPLHASPDAGARRDIAGEIARCVGIATGLGLETIVLDHSRPDIPLRTVKVVVPGLCHIWPELGNQRLYGVPVAMGWHNAPLQEADLNPQALYV